MKKNIRPELNQLAIGKELNKLNLLQIPSGQLFLGDGSHTTKALSSRNRSPMLISEQGPPLKLQANGSGNSRLLQKIQSIKTQRDTTQPTSPYIGRLEVPEQQRPNSKHFKIRVSSAKTRRAYSVKQKETTKLEIIQKKEHQIKYLTIFDSELILKKQSHKQKKIQDVSVNQPNPWNFTKEKKIEPAQHPCKENSKEKVRAQSKQSKPVNNQGQPNEKKRSRNIKVAYFKPENRLVTLFALEKDQKNQEIRIRHSSLIPIYGQVQLEGERFVVSDQHENYSLRNMLEEFGALGEILAKRYLRQLALGLHHLHSHKRSHNCLTPDAVLYNNSGSLLINLLQAVTIPNKDELKHKELHYFSPDFLLQRKRFEPKNDVWGLGCLAILMVTGTNVFCSTLHPYNSTNHTSNEKTMLQNVKELYQKYFQQQSQQLKPLPKMSRSAKSLISECLKILKEQRPNILALLQHQFLEN